MRAPGEAFRAEMTITAAEFARTLGLFARRAGLPLNRAGEGRWHLGAALVSVRRMQDLRLGVLRLERLEVNLDLSALAGEEREDFRRSFMLSFHRGGG